MYLRMAVLIDSTYEISQLDRSLPQGRKFLHCVWKSSETILLLSFWSVRASIVRAGTDKSFPVIITKNHQHTQRPIVSHHKSKIPSYLLNNFPDGSLCPQNIVSRSLKDVSWWTESLLYTEPLLISDRESKPGIVYKTRQGLNIGNSGQKTLFRCANGVISIRT